LASFDELQISNDDYSGDGRGGGDYDYGSIL